MIGIRYTSSVSGEIAKFVSCEECDESYGYWMKRTASGSGVSYFLMDRDHAAGTASREARASLAKRLRTECDPVPCPHCGHYQEDMIPAAREAKFGWIFKAGIIAGVALAVFLYLAARLIGLFPLAVLAFPAAFLIPALAYVASQALGMNYDPNRDLRDRERIRIGRKLAMSRKEMARLRDEVEADPYEHKRRRDLDYD